LQTLTMDGKCSILLLSWMTEFTLITSTTQSHYYHC